MTPKDFDALLKETVSEMETVLLYKGKDYSSETDRLCNFKVNAERLELKPLQIWAVYFMKHIDSILNYVKNGVSHSEPIEGRFLDALNYLVLGRGLIKELKSQGDSK